MTLLEELPHFSLWHDPSCSCLYATWRGSHSGSLTRAQYGLIRWHVQATQSHKLLNDSLLDGDGWQELTRWLADECFRVLADEGLQAVAWVLPRHLGALRDTEQVLAHLTQPLVDTFTDAQTAYDWLHRWPTTTAQPMPNATPATTAAFLALPQAQQVSIAEQYGQPLVPSWEPDFYVKSYVLGGILRVEIAYHIHSGLLHRVRAYNIPRW